MPRPAANLHSLVRGRVRQLMNKYNLFNLYKRPRPQYNRQLLFQQKWAAKQETRAYHGEPVKELRFKTIFNPRLAGVAPLDASLRGESTGNTPFKLQTYAALENRLEVALFRAMFASSVRQARRFILLGFVKVNGVVVKHSEFTLLPGDVFSVVPERVMEALGKPKPSVKKSLAVDRTQIAVWNKHLLEIIADPKKGWEKHMKKQAAKAKEVKVDKKALGDMKLKQRQVTQASVLAQLATSWDVAAFPEAARPQLANVVELLKGKEIGDAAAFLGRTKEELKGGEVVTARKVKQALTTAVREIQESIRVGQAQKGEDKMVYDPNWYKNMKFCKPISKEQVAEVLEAENPEKALHGVKVSLPWQKGSYGYGEQGKKYFTPWTPREFLAPFAINPHHIEVDWVTCHAVYLRDPVARPGHSEVISPFGEEVHERAYMWYQRGGM